MGINYFVFYQLSAKSTSWELTSFILNQTMRSNGPKKKLIKFIDDNFENLSVIKLTIKQQFWVESPKY